MGLSDAELCERARAGDRGAVEALVARHYGLATHFARLAKAPPGFELDDLVQEGLMAIARSAVKWKPEYGTLFCTYASNAILNRISRFITDRRTRPFSGRATREDDQLPPRRPVLDLTAHLSGLHHIARAVVSLYFGLEGTPLRIGEIGERLGMTRGQVKATLEDSIRLMRLVARPEE